MKTHIIRSTRVGLSNVASVFAQKTTTWALEAAIDDQKDRQKILVKGLKQEAKFASFLQDKGLTPKDVSDYMQTLADTYDICLK